jgi:hypothetical protein
VFSATTRQFTIYTTDNAWVGAYVIEVLATANDASSKTGTLAFALSVTKASSSPSFSVALVDQTLSQGTSLKYTLPTTTDT